MPSLIDYRRRIRSVKNTQQITKAMKMVSAAKLRRTQDRVVASRPYSKSLNDLLSNIVAAAQSQGLASDPLLEVREQKKVALVLITSDRGLAGAYNANLVKFATKYIADHVGPAYQLEAFGRKGRDFFKKRNFTIAGEYVGRLEKATMSDAKELATKLIEQYRSGEIDAVHLIYSEFKGVMSQIPQVLQVLPVNTPAVAEGEVSRDYIYEQKPQELLATLLPKYVEAQIYRGLLEANTGQHAARMAAMDSASRNCSEVIDDLTLTMNRIRQAAITKEIIEVVSGASSV
jgi:F-type H+-transporting ATPase subunit gamma